MITPEQRAVEQAFSSAEKKRAPELFSRPPMTDTPEFLEKIGITGLFRDLPLGYIKLTPQDFLVEEVTPNGNVITVDDGPLLGHLEHEGGTYYAELVKCGIPAFNAYEEILAALGLDRKQFGYAGIKDRMAVTAQRVSFRGITDPNAFQKIKSDYYFLKNITRGKGTISMAELKGNRFTITARLPAPLTPAQIAAFQETVQDIRENGFWNFFSFQRFGTPRLLSHEYGKLLLRGDYQGVVKLYFTEGTSREFPYFVELRRRIAEAWGDWPAVKEIVTPFPMQLEIENNFADHLIKNPTDFLGALRLVPEQIRLWFYAYASHLFNRKLSELITSGEAPMSLPLINSYKKSDWEPYLEYLKADGVSMPSPHYKDFPFVSVESRACPTTQPVQIHDVVTNDRFAVFSFTLPKGAYATTFLMHFFMLSSGTPLPENIPTDPVDSKAALSIGTLEPILKKFEKAIAEQEAEMEE